MTLTVYVQLDGSSATYEVKDQVDGIYKAILLHKGNHISYQFPEKIILIWSNGSWTSDCPNKVVSSKIVRKITEHESPSTIPILKDEVNPLSKPQNTTVVPCRILIIDDDEDDVAILADAFIQWV